MTPRDLSMTLEGLKVMLITEYGTLNSTENNELEQKHYKYLDRDLR
jgi:starvation-inducible outer membrane lipoprotein